MPGSGFEYLGIGGLFCKSSSVTLLCVSVGVTSLVCYQDLPGLQYKIKNKKGSMTQASAVTTMYQIYLITSSILKDWDWDGGPKNLSSLKPVKYNHNIVQK